jgi:predicted ester cyclase
MGADENKALARTALEEVWSARGSVAAEEVYAPEFVSHQHSHPTVSDLRGIEALKAFVAELQEAFPDFTDRVERQIAEGDLVMTQFTSAGTHRGDLIGIAPTGRRSEWMGFELARIEKGRIAENWVSSDMYGMLQQLGAVSPGRLGRLRPPAQRHRDLGAWPRGRRSGRPTAAGLRDGVSAPGSIGSYRRRRGRASGRRARRAPCPAPGSTRSRW